MLPKVSISKILNSKSKDKFNLISKSNFDWDEVFFNCSPQVVFYRSNYIEFAFECIRGNNIECEDLSLGVELDGKIIALFPLFFTENRNALGFWETASALQYLFTPYQKK